MSFVWGYKWGVVGRAGLEPATFCVSGRCPNQARRPARLGVLLDVGFSGKKAFWLLVVCVGRFLYLYVILSLKTVEVEGKGAHVVEEEIFLLEPSPFSPLNVWLPCAFPFSDKR